MGLLQSVFCSITFCLERVLTWTCCAFLLMLLMFTILMLMIYGISVGYHYAQKELASFSMTARTTTLVPPRLLMRRSGSESRPVVRLVAVNRSSVERAQEPHVDEYQTKKPAQNVYLDASDAPIVLLETQVPPVEPEMLPHEKDLARKLIGRFRRSKNLTTVTTSIPFLRPLRELTPVAG